MLYSCCHYNVTFNGYRVISTKTTVRDMTPSCLAQYMHVDTTVKVKTKGSSTTITTNYHTARCHVLTVVLRQDSYSSPNTIRKIKWAGHVARMGQQHVGFW